MRALHYLFVIPTMNFWTSVENKAPKLFFGVCKPARLCAYNLTFIPSGVRCWNISLVNLLMSCVVGGDDRRVLLWDMEKAMHTRAKPIKLKGEHLSNIFCLAFDSTNKRVFSGGKTSSCSGLWCCSWNRGEIKCLMFLSVAAGNDEQVILHDVERGDTLNVFLHDDAVYGLSVSPVNDNVFASSSDDGRVLIWDTREPPHGGAHSIL